MVYAYPFPLNYKRKKKTTWKKRTELFNLLFPVYTFFGVNEIGKKDE